MYVVLPMWLAAGFADYLCHRAARIETTSGWKESALHLLQFAEMAVPTLAAIFLEINALIFLIMIIAIILHHATAIWDVSYAYQTRVVTPTEQHIHSFLEILPFTGFLIVAILHWQELISLFGFGPLPAEFSLRMKEEPLPWVYVTVMLTAVLLFEVFPYFEEFLRSWRAQKAIHARQSLAMEPANSSEVIPPIEKEKAPWRASIQAAQAGGEEEMHRYKRGKAKSGPGGRGGKVTSRKQAIDRTLQGARGG
jgi:hypothetical protein